MCNCSSSPSNICSQCASGRPCGCPPNYTILPASVPCTCCPPGYTFQGITPNWPNGYCQNLQSPNLQTVPIPCNSCEDSLSADCIILPAIPSLGIAAGASLTSFINYLSSAAFTDKILNNIGLDPTLAGILCSLVQLCPPVGGDTIPVIGEISKRTWCCSNGLTYLSDPTAFAINGTGGFCQYGTPPVISVVVIPTPC